MHSNEFVKSVSATFRQQHQSEPLVVRSPGRVNIIGEHTDYNEGFVLPAAINKAIYVAVGKREDDRIVLYSSGFSERFEIAMRDLKIAETRWANYILGVVAQFQKNGHVIGGFNLVFDGDIPIGAGLSSSAAVECATGLALNELFELGIEREALAKMAQKAEHEYAGVMCGIMDQFASVFGKKDQVIKLDCRSLEYEYVPFKLEGIDILLLNTNVEHALASTEYNTRRAQCESGVQMIRKHNSSVKSLRDADMNMLDQFVAPVDEVVYRRCRYVVQENIRLLEGCEDLRKGDIKALGKKMYASHDGLSKEYEVSCPQLDFLVDAVRNVPDVLGARMMGGGFGGCTINLVREEAIPALVESVSKAYLKTMQLELTHYVAQIGDGTAVMREG